jgi:predicted NBD/HSP70 family sugar kinase
MPQQAPDDVVNVTLSVGQSKIGAGAIDRSGNEVCRLEEIVTPRESSARFAAIVQQIVAVIHEEDLQNVGYVGVSFPGIVSKSVDGTTKPQAGLQSFRKVGKQTK